MTASIHRIVLAYAVLIFLYAATFIGVQVLTEFMFSMQVFGLVSMISFIWLPFHGREWKNIFLFFLKMFLVHGLALIGTISVALINSGGNSVFVLVSWLVAASFGCFALLQFIDWKEESMSKSTAASLGFSFSCVAIIFFIIYVTQPITGSFEPGYPAFRPQTITYQTLNESGVHTVASSNCRPKLCHTLSWPRQMIAFSKPPLPDGFEVVTSILGVQADIYFRKPKNSTFPDYCDAYKIMIRCGNVYTVNVGSIWIGNDCPYEKRSYETNYLDQGCHSRDFSAITYVLFLGVGTIFLFTAMVYWVHSLQKKEEEVDPN